MNRKLRLDNSKTSLPGDFNWMAVLKDLAQGAPLSDYEHNRLVVMAGGWPTCACGQLCSALPRISDQGRPLDMRLGRMGQQFFNCIEVRDWKNALALFHAIEARTIELLDEISHH